MGVVMCPLFDLAPHFVDASYVHVNSSDEEIEEISESDDHDRGSLSRGLLIGYFKIFR